MIVATQDDDHRKAVNKLIPLAVKHADDNHQPGHSTEEWAKLFMDKMDQLTISVGLRMSLEELLAAKREEAHGK